MFSLTAQKGSMYDAVFHFYRNHYQNLRKSNLSLSLCEDIKREWKLPVYKDSE